MALGHYLLVDFLTPKFMAEIGVPDFKGSEQFGQARFIAPGRVFAVRDAADINNVADVVRLDQRDELHKAEAVMPDCVNRLSHTLLYKKCRVKINIGGGEGRVYLVYEPFPSQNDDVKGEHSLPLRRKHQAFDFIIHIGPGEFTQ